MSLTSETTAICGVINDQFPLTDPAVAPDKAAAQTSDHIIVFVSRRYTGGFRASGEESVPGGRVVIRYVNKSVANLSNNRDKARAVIEDKAVGNLGPFVFETENPVGEDDGWFVASDSFTY